LQRVRKGVCTHHLVFRGSCQRARNAFQDVDSGIGATALRFDPGGLHLAAGTSDGCTALYDIRSARPLMVKDQQYGQPIVDIR